MSSPSNNLKDNLMPDKKTYKLGDFVVSPVDAPPSTPVLFVDHGIVIDGVGNISLAKISDLEALVVTERNLILDTILAGEPGKLIPYTDKQDKFAVGYAHAQKDFKAMLEGLKNGS